MKRIKYITAFVCFILIIILGVNTVNGINRAIYPTKYSQYVEKYCEQYGVELKLAYAVIKTESNFDPSALSSADAKGLMQLTDDTFYWLQYRKGVKGSMNAEALYDPETNLDYGIYLLSYLSQRYNGDYKLVLSAYHAGVGSVASWLSDSEYSDDGITLKNIPYADTKNYVSKVNKNIERYSKIYNF